LTATLSGSSGRHSYQAGYEVDGNNITIGLPFSTMMACAESDGIMEQEFLTSLGAAGSHCPNL
jgi:heat shock protein HslJ